MKSKQSNTQDKEMFLVPDATHIKTYYVPEYVQQVVEKPIEFQ